MAQGVTGALEFSATKYMAVRMSYSEEYDIATNTSKVSIVQVEVKSTSWYGYTYYLDGTITVNGTTAVSMSSSAGTSSVRVAAQNNWYTVGNSSGSVSGIQHNADGSKTIAISVNITGYTSNGSGNSGWTSNGSQNVTLATIPRTSSISFGNGTIGSAVQVSINRASDAFTHTVILQFGNYSAQVTGATTSASIGTDLSWCNAIPNSTSGTGTVTCITYSGGTEIGRVSAYITMVVPDNVVPTVSATARGLSLFRNLYLQGFSSVRISASGYGAYGSAVLSYFVSGGGYNASGKDVTIGPLNSTGDIVFTVSATDSRGRTGVSYVSVSVVPYSNPAISIRECFRCDSSGKASFDGQYINVKADFSCAPVNGENAVSCNVSYGELNGYYYTGNTPILPGISKVVFDGNILTQKGWSVKFSVVDTVGTEITDKFDISSSANYLITAKKGYVALCGYPDFTKNPGAQINGDLYVSGATHGITPKSIGAAPENHGLNENTPIPDGANLNNYRTPGKYSVSDSSKVSTLKNTPGRNVAFQLTVERIIGQYRADGLWTYMRQTIRYFDGPEVRRLIYTGGTTSWAYDEWEWLDPPMEIGIEYRTTEYYLEKPVYAKAVDFGSGPNNSRKGVAHGCAATGIVRCYAQSSNGDSIPMWYNTNTVFVYANKINIHLTTSYNASAQTYKVCLFYTKK